ncbi:MAG: helix-hairpin-helix domain-containing protein [Thermotogota bacterium]|nr:helix-hairpin-helix domain-containing protein [Thermotogota bacterium]
MRKEELAMQFDLLSRLLKVIRDNPFKARTYEFAARVIRSNLPSGRLTSDDVAGISSIKGIGKAVKEKAIEFLESGEMKKTSELKNMMPSAVYLLAFHDLIDPEVISFIWKDMGLEKPLEIVNFLANRKESLKLSQDRLSKIEAILLEDQTG